MTRCPVRCWLVPAFCVLCGLALAPGLRTGSAQEPPTPTAEPSAAAALQLAISTPSPAKRTWAGGTILFVVADEPGVQKLDACLAGIRETGVRKVMLSHASWQPASPLAPKMAYFLQKLRVADVQFGVHVAATKPDGGPQGWEGTQQRLLERARALGATYCYLDEAATVMYSAHNALRREDPDTAMTADALEYALQWYNAGFTIVGTSCAERVGSWSHGIGTADAWKFGPTLAEQVAGCVEILRGWESNKTYFWGSRRRDLGWLGSVDLGKPARYTPQEMRMALLTAWQIGAWVDLQVALSWFADPEQRDVRLMMGGLEQARRHGGRWEAPQPQAAKPPPG